MADCDSRTQRVQRGFDLKKVLKGGGVLLAAIAIASCAKGGKQLDVAGEDANYEEQIGVYSDPAADPNGMDPVAAAAFWGMKYDKNPKDWKAAVKYSTALRKIGSVEQSVKVMTKVSNFYGQEPEVALETARGLVEAGRAFEAIRHVDVAHNANSDDWRTLSVYGVALDQIGEHVAARAKYDKALSIAPGVVSLLNNKGLSFALDGNLSEAKRVLSAATSAPGSDARVRQNLALVLAIKGDMLEAERLARSDLPPQIADGNINFYRSLVVQPAYWQDFASEEIDAPVFDTRPAQPQMDVPAGLLPTTSNGPSPLAPTTQNGPETAPKTKPAITKSPVVGSNQTDEPASFSSVLAQPQKTDGLASQSASASTPTSSGVNSVKPTSFDPALEVGQAVDEMLPELPAEPVYIDPLSTDDTVIDLKKIGS